MECRQLEITVICADNLPIVREPGKMRVYAQVSVRGLPTTVSITPVDRERGINPYWNCKIKYTLPELVVQTDGVLLAIELYAERSLLPDKYIGEVNLKLKNLFNSGFSQENLEYDVDRNDADGAFGKLKISYNFAKTTIKVSASESKSFGGEVAEAVGHGVLHAVIHGALHIILH